MFTSPAVVLEGLFLTFLPTEVGAQLRGGYRRRRHQGTAAAHANLEAASTC
jgi:hypothetical protein